MVYLIPDDFREPTLIWATRNLVLTDSEADDVVLADAIEAMSTWLDYETADHFAPNPGPVPPDAEVDTTLDVFGTGTPKLTIPQRIRSITKIETRDLDGTLTEENVLSYRVASSVSGTAVDLRAYDSIWIIPGWSLTLGTAVWPFGVQSVRLTGKFGWPSTPKQVQRAVALMVWDDIKNWNPDLRRASRMDQGGSSFEFAPMNPTGLPEADRVIEQYRRPQSPGP